MKYIVALIVAFSTPAYAENYLVMPYNDQVRIVLSEQKCDQSGFRGVAQRIDKQYMKMCWSLDKKTGMVHIKWEGGDFSEFPASNFSPVEVK
jgi:hypothetical protein